MSEQRQYATSKVLTSIRVFLQKAWPYAVLLAIISGFAVLDFHPSIFHSFNCTTINLAATNKASNGLFMDNQVIVRGLIDDVTKFATVHDLIMLEGCDLSYLNSRANPDQKLTEQQRKSLVMHLYEDRSGRNFEEVIAEIEKDSTNYNVIVDPNYLTRIADSTGDPCARPADAGGTGGGPFGDPYIPDLETNEARQASQAFFNQWAFGIQGINLPDSSSFTGDGVRVAVFDTSPYRNRLPFLRIIGIAQPSFMWLIGWDATGPTTVSNHGLFVAGLIHRIAPNSNIHMIQVLDNNGCGQLWVLNKALEDYTSRISRWSGDLNRTVINMSLGIKKANLQNQDDLDTLSKAIQDAYDNGAIIVAAAGNDSTKIKEGDDIIEQIMDMQIPASDTNVIGVIATNQKGQRSCYSNKKSEGDGDERNNENEKIVVAAPGGEGGEEPSVDQDGGQDNEQNDNQDGGPVNLCAPRASSWDKIPVPCTDMGNCQYGLISLVQTRNGPQYMLWSGTSFATPLVSGLAALAYEEGNRDQVRCLIREGGAVKQADRLNPNPNSDPIMGWGLINVDESLSPEVLSGCGVRQR